MQKIFQLVTQTISLTVQGLEHSEEEDNTDFHCSPYWEKIDFGCCLPLTLIDLKQTDKRYFVQ